MSGIFNTLNTSTKGLMAQQTSIHTVGHNISNAKTPGFSRQRVDMQADLAYNMSGVGQLGTGVKMAGIVRLVNEYVHNQIMDENGSLERFAVKSATMGQLEIIFNEPSETGLSYNLGQMFDSFQELSKTPESLNAKTVVVEQAKALASTLNHMSNQIDKLRDNTINEIKKTALDFNTIVDGIESLNKQIFNIAIKGQVPNDLLDQRDLMLKNLSGTTEFEHKFDEYGRTEIKIGGDILLSNKLTEGQERQELSMVVGKENVDGQWKITVAKGGGSPEVYFTTNEEHIESISVGDVFTNARKAEGITEDNVKPLVLKSGSMLGYQESLGDIKERKSNLDIFAGNMAKLINIVHGNLLDENDNPVDGIKFFQASEGEEINAGNIMVNDELSKDSGKVNAGKYTDSPEGDGSRALALARLRNTKISFSDSDVIIVYNDDMSIKNDPGGTSVEGAYIDIVTKVGVSKQHSDQMVNNQEVLLAQLEFRRESVSGVSIDEEVSNLVQFQKAYEANAKMISVLAEMLDVLINRTGV